MNNQCLFEPSQLDRIEAKLDQLLAKKKPGKPRASKDDYPEWFEELWKAYPKRAGSNPKRKAYHAANTRLNGLNLPNAELFEKANKLGYGTQRYAAFCDATGKTGTEFVMQAATFFGPDKHYENDWTIPAKAEKIPHDDDEMVAWASKKGFRDPKLGESYFQYRKALEAWGRS